MASRPVATRRSVRVAALELPQRFGDVEGSLDRVDALLAPLAGVDLALLPETILTGYVSPDGDVDLTPFAEPLDGATAARLAALARAHGLALAGPLVERDGARCFNALVLFDRTGARVGHWRKRHPWVLERWATPGDLGSPVVSLAGLELTAAVCYDVHFLAAEAAAALDAADLLLFPSAWVDPRDHLDLRGELLTALARRHRLWVLNANWGPSRPRLPGQGRSMIVAPDGAIVARTPYAPRAGALCVDVPLPVRASPRRAP